MPWFPGTIDILQRGLEAAHLRHSALANNLANVNTPGYKAVRVQFEEHLALALDRAEQRAPTLQLVSTRPRHLSPSPPDPTQVQPVVQRDLSRSMRVDGNNIDIEAEMARVASNQIWYSALTRQLSDELGRLRLAITEGRR